MKITKSTTVKLTFFFLFSQSDGQVLGIELVNKPDQTVN